ncbi:hypothetical protein GMB50_12590 [Turicibacter sanguinis]|nr:hypothetical protein [Turicibacter sanguinis]MTP48353.1 hypothetical protein [Turicibacter sanguinis]MTP50441.1 hypothetical protein [Turicibacter sanguinis]MTQ06752.1 hypothetical protein [Turicibacter sanguinis]
MNIRMATLEDVETLHNLHFALNRHRHSLQPTNYQGKSMDEEWIEENIKTRYRDYILLEVDNDIKGMALVEIKETYSVPGSVKYKYLDLMSFYIVPELDLNYYGHELFTAVRAWGKKYFLSYIQLHELINDVKMVNFLAREQLAVTQQTFKCVI